VILITSSETPQYSPEYGSMGTAKEITAIAIRIFN
jgi:hypothetical protein